MSKDDDGSWVCDVHGMISSQKGDAGELAAVEHLRLEHPEVWGIAGSAEDAEREPWESLEDVAKRLVDAGEDVRAAPLNREQRRAQQFRRNRRWN